MRKSTVDDLRSYLIRCIDKEGIIDGKRRFSLQLGMLENALFIDVDEAYASIHHLKEHPDYLENEEAGLEELPTVDEDGGSLLELEEVC